MGRGFFVCHAALPDTEHREYVAALYKLQDGVRGAAVGAAPEWARSKKTESDPSLRSG